MSRRFVRSLSTVLPCFLGTAKTKEARKRGFGALLTLQAELGQRVKNPLPEGEITRRIAQWVLDEFALVAGPPGAARLFEWAKRIAAYLRVARERDPQVLNEMAEAPPRRPAPCSKPPRPPGARGSGRPSAQGTRRRSGCWRSSDSRGITSPWRRRAKWPGSHARCRDPVSRVPGVPPSFTDVSRPLPFCLILLEHPVRFCSPRFHPFPTFPEAPHSWQI